MTASGRSPRVLIVDDDVSFCRMLVELLSANGFVCAGTASAEEALALLEAEPFDLGIFDVVMPDMSGWELAAEAKKIAPGTRLMAVSGVVCSPDLIDCGYDVALHKPLDIERFVRMCRKLAASSRGESGHRGEPPEGSPAGSSDAT
jgi:DNA-binding response OmpR family regulator